MGSIDRGHIHEDSVHQMSSTEKHSHLSLRFEDMRGKQKKIVLYRSNYLTL
jgi:hypothetical protein